MKPLAVFKLGSTFPQLARQLGDFDDWIRAALVNVDVNVTTVHVEQGEQLPPPESISGAILTGSHSMVTERLDWSLRAADWLRAAVPAGTPILGICYGHQLLAEAFGGHVADRPAGREVGTHPVTLLPAASADPLFAKMPDVFFAHTSHQQSALRLPEGGRSLATTPNERHAAFSLGPRAWGVQFHPEFTQPVMAGYVEQRRDELRDSHLNPERILASIQPAPVAASILTRFVKLAQNPTVGQFEEN